jgi:hypothetical protein
MGYAVGWGLICMVTKVLGTVVRKKGQFWGMFCARHSTWFCTKVTSLPFPKNGDIFITTFKAQRR